MVPFPFAWFQVGDATLGKQATHNPAAISTTDAGHSLGNVNVKLTWSGLTQAAELSDGQGKTYYYVDDTHKVEKTVTLANQLGSATWTVDWETSYPVEQRIAAATKSVTFTINKIQGRVHLLTDDTKIKDNALAENISIVITVEADGSLSSSTGSLTGSVVFRVDGGTDTTNDGHTTVAQTLAAS